MRQYRPQRRRLRGPVAVALALLLLPAATPARPPSDAPLVEREGPPGRQRPSLDAADGALPPDPTEAETAELEVPEAEAPDSDTPRSWSISLDWDGLHYELGEKLPLFGQVIPLHDFEEVKLRGRIGVAFDLDGGHRSLSDGVEDGWKGSVRRGRIYTRGRFTWWTPTEYKVEFGFEESDFFLNDFFVLWRNPKWLDQLLRVGPLDVPVDELRFGYFDPPVSLDALTSSAERTFMEPAAPIAAFAPGLRLGADVRGVSDRLDLTWTFGVSSVGQSRNVGDTSDAPLRAAGRLIWHPTLQRSADSEPSQLHLGASVNFSFSGSGDVRYRARPESLLAPFIVDTRRFNADSSSGCGVEAAWGKGPFNAQAEGIYVYIDSGSDGLDFYGAYAQASWTLTGEVRPYDSLRATFRRVEPSKPVTFRPSGWGAWQLAARASWLDASDGDVRGGAMWSTTFGINWIWNRRVRIQFNYIYADVSEKVDSPQGHIAQMRFQLRI